MRLKLVVLILIIKTFSVYSLPGTIIGHYNDIPKIELTSLSLESCEVLKIFNVEGLPKQSNWQEHAFYYENRNRTVYLTKDKKYAIKIWQKNCAATSNFLRAFQAGFYEGIAKIAGLVFDESDECRGYISPYIIDREGNRKSWDAFEVLVEKGPIGVKIFAPYHVQPKIYRDLFDKILININKTSFFTYDVCPDNIAFDQSSNYAYLIDLEDAVSLEAIDNHVVSQILNHYCPRDYVRLLTKHHQEKK